MHVRELEDRGREREEWGIISLIPLGQQSHMAFHYQRCRWLKRGSAIEIPKTNIDLSRSHCCHQPTCTPLPEDEKNPNLSSIEHIYAAVTAHDVSYIHLRLNDASDTALIFLIPRRLGSCLHKCMPVFRCGICSLLNIIAWERHRQLCIRSQNNQAAFAGMNCLPSPLRLGFL